MEIKDYKESPISAEHEQYIRDGILELTRIIKEQRVNDTGAITPDVLNAIYPYLRRNTGWSKKKKDYAVGVLGIGLGYCFVSQLGFHWIQVNDHLGETLAVKHTESNWTCFPFSSVAKRIRTSEKNFFTGIFDTFANDIEKKKRS